MTFDVITDSQTKLMLVSDLLNKPIHTTLSGYCVSITKPTKFPTVEIELLIHYNDDRLCLHSRQIEKDHVIDDVELIGFDIVTKWKTDRDFIKSYLIGNQYRVED